MHDPFALRELLEEREQRGGHADAERSVEGFVRELLMRWPRAIELEPLEQGRRDTFVRMRIRGVIVAAVVMSWVVGGPVAAESGNAGWVTLRVSRVQVKPRKVDGTTWDLKEEKIDNDCGLIGTLGTAAVGAIGGGLVTFLCSRSRQAPQGRDATAPDLVLQVTAGDMKYRTPIAPDTFAEAFDVPIVVPLDGIPAAGLEIQVLDQDLEVGAGELIGMVRVTRRRLQDALASDTPLLTLSDSQLDKLEVEVAGYAPPAPIKPVTFQVNQRPTAIGARVRAGELVILRARGKYSVADNREQLDENGYTKGQKRDHNIKRDFDKANHGAAIAYIGAPTESHAALVVGSCVMAVAPVAGPLHVGINDGSPDNNQGTVVFEAQIITPTVDQWRAGGAFLCPGRAGQYAEAPLPDAQAPGLPESLARAMISDAVSKLRQEIMACGTPASAGDRVKVIVRVAPDGGVTSVALEGAPDATLGNCVVAAMRKAVFPRTKQGGSFSYPFVF